MKDIVRSSIRFAIEKMPFGFFDEAGTIAKEGGGRVIG